MGDPLAVRRQRNVGRARVLSREAPGGLTMANHDHVAGRKCMDRHGWVASPAVCCMQFDPNST